MQFGVDKGDKKMTMEQLKDFQNHAHDMTLYMHAHELFNDLAKMQAIYEEFSKKHIPPLLRQLVDDSKVRMSTFQGYKRTVSFGWDNAAFSTNPDEETDADVLDETGFNDVHDYYTSRSTSGSVPPLELDSH